MDLQTYTSFLEELGNKVIWSNGIPFYPYRPGFLWSVPQFVSYDIRPGKLMHLVWSKAVCVIYASTKFGSEGKKQWICHGPEYDINLLHSRTRSKVRRGIEKCEIRPLRWEELIDEGLQMNVESLGRQKRASGRLDNAEWWIRQCRVSSNYEDVRIWGAFIGGNLASYIWVNIHDDIHMDNKSGRVANIVNAMSYSKYLKNDPEYGRCYPNEALLYRVTKELLDSENCTSVVHGFECENASLESWKKHMGYVKLPLLQSIVANPVLHLVKPFIPKIKNLINQK